MTRPMTVEQIRAHPGTARAIVPDTPSSAGRATVARNRTGGPVNLACEFSVKESFILVMDDGVNWP